jgi:hypothetical protein
LKEPAARPHRYQILLPIRIDAPMKRAIEKASWQRRMSMAAYIRAANLAALRKDKITIEQEGI